MSIAEELQAAIQKNLPAAVALELQSFIEQAKRDSTDLAALRSRFDAVDGQRRELANEGDRQRTALNNWAKRETELKEREEKVLDAEHRLEIADLKIGHANALTAHGKELFGMVFRNTIVRETALGTQERPMYTQFYDNSAGRRRSEVTGSYQVPDERTTERKVE